MAHWYESRIDRQIREAQERGEFDNLPGAGKPLPDAGRPLGEDWWLKDLLRRENLSFAGPATLMLRKEVEEFAAALAKKKTEQQVRLAVAALNEKIVRAQRGLMDGPSVVIRTIDEDEAVRAWRSARS
ncbi:DUF1992 domain-containing protein [Longispora albida]|uniref:DnaJ family domain-containing protein n=1 Tax=Longispora albida TaxID=203523 RepID=UPI00037D60DD|nr:DUF1992 domain-containing protein [Longispora albida]